MPGILLREKNVCVNPRISKKRSQCPTGEQESRIGGDRYLFDTNGDRFNANTATLRSTSLTARKVEVINGKKYLIVS